LVHTTRSINLLHKKRHVVFLFLLFILTLQLYSVETVSKDIPYSISSYNFTIDGSTKEGVLRKALFSADDKHIFKTEEEMITYLDQKKQFLINMRFFSVASYTYTIDPMQTQNTSYIVNFYIEDASTFLILPYPKFDNDTMGLRLGVKMFEKNLFGTFADLEFVGHISQGEGGVAGWENREDFIALDISSLPIGTTELDFSIDYSQKKNSSSNGEFDINGSWNNITLFKSKLSISSWADFSPSSDFSMWNVEEYGLSWNIGPFRLNGELASLSNTLKVHTNKSKFYTYTRLKSSRVKFLFIPVDFSLSAETDMDIESREFYYFNGGATIESSYNLPFKFKWTPSAGAFIHIKPTFSSLAYSYLFENTFTKSSINWNGNFRKGLAASFTHTVEEYPQADYEDLSYWKIETRATWFPFYTKNFNPSFQFTGLFTDPDHGKKFDFYESAANNLRGIWSRTIENLGLNDDLTMATMYNVNLSMNFINFGFAKSYISPFFDLGIFKDPTNDDELLVLTTAGVEGYAIINKYPSYPIRGSLGFNLSDIKRVINDEISITDIEFELSIGMGLFF